MIDEEEGEEERGEDEGRLKSRERRQSSDDGVGDLGEL